MKSGVIQPIDNPEEIFEIIKSSIGDCFSLEELIRVIEKIILEKEIHINLVPLPPDITGRTYNLLDAIVIQLNTYLDKDHAQCVCCHEIGHIVLNHVKLTFLTYKQFSVEYEEGRIEHLPAAYRQHKTIFDSPQEQDAEDMGLLLIECIERWESTLPDLAQDIYGND